MKHCEQLSGQRALSSKYPSTLLLQLCREDEVQHRQDAEEQLSALSHRLFGHGSKLLSGISWRCCGSPSDLMPATQIVRFKRDLRLEDRPP